MQTPVGFEMRDGVAFATSWFDIIFNPSFPYRLSHMLLASGLTASFLIAGVSAYRWLRQDRTPAVMAAIKAGVYTAAILIPVQIFIGDLHGLNTLKYQPQKIAAMEALYETQKGAPLVLFAVPNEATKTNDYSIELPKMASVFLTHDRNGEVKGLNEFVDNHPPVAPVFWAFRIMVGTGILMLLISWCAVWCLVVRKNIPKYLAIVLIPMAFSGWVATDSGWYVTEVGRQPWLVQGVLKTADAVSNVPSAMIGVSLTLYLILYAVLLIAFITTLFYMARKAGDKAKDKTAPSSGQAIVEVIAE